MKAVVGQLQTQGVFPVNPSPYSLRGLSITQIFHELHDADQGELPGMESRLTLERIDGGEQVIVKEGAQPFTQPQVDVAVREGRVGDTGGFSRNGVQAIAR